MSRPKTTDEVMAELEADPDFQSRKAERTAAHAARLRESEPDFALVRAALEATGLPSADFGRFTSGRHPDVIRPSVFDYKASVPVLLVVLPLVQHPSAKEAVVRSLTTSYARPVAADALIREFRNTSATEQPALKWAIGNALDTVTPPEHVDVLLELALDKAHGAGRQMIVDRVARISKDARVVDALKKLATDEDVAFHAMAGLRRRLGQAEAAEVIRPLTNHESERVRDAARRQLKRAERPRR
jgi:hypothetical protein